MLSKPNVFLAALVGSVSFVPIAHAAALRTVALTGQAVPGTPEGVNYESFGFVAGSAILRGLVINDAGQAAFELGRG